MSEIINPQYIKEFEEMEKLYPTILNRLKERSVWALILLDNAFKFLKKLALEDEFKEQLEPNECQVYKTFKKIFNMELEE